MLLKSPFQLDVEGPSVHKTDKNPYPSGTFTAVKADGNPQQVNHTGCGDGRERVGKMKLGRGQMAGGPLAPVVFREGPIRQEWEWRRGHLGEEHSERDEGPEVGTLDLPGVFKEQEGGQWGWGSVRMGRRDAVALTLALTPSETGESLEGSQERAGMS